MSVSTMIKPHLSDRVGVDDRDWEIRRRAVQLSDEDVKILRSLEPWARDNVQEIVEAAYDHLASFPDAERMLRATGRSLEDLKAMQRSYFLAIFKAQFDSAYVESRLELGALHAEIRITPRWFMAKQAAYVREIDLRFARHFGLRSGRMRAAMLAVLRVLSL